MPNIVNMAPTLNNHNEEAITSSLSAARGLTAETKDFIDIPNSIEQQGAF